MNEVVKYHNDMNDVGLRKFNAVELDLLMAICSKMKEKGLVEITFTFNQIKEITKYEQNNNRFYSYLETMYDKLISLNFKIGTEREFTKFVLFTTYTLSEKNQNITIGVNPKFSWILNNLTSNFTRFELEEFVNFKSSYTKEFYRRMKQFRTTGIWNISIEDFKRLLDIPIHYRVTDIDKWVLTPIKKELKEKYKLKITKKYGKLSSRGRPAVVGFEFKFKTDIYTSLKEKNEEILTTQYLEYLYRTIRLFDKNFKRYNYLKIIHIQKLDNEKIIMTVINQDDNYKSQITLNNEQHLHNFVQKNLI